LTNQNALLKLRERIRKSGSAIVSREIKNIILEKEKIAGKVDAVLDEEWEAYDVLEGMLESGDYGYGYLRKGNIIKARRKISLAMQHQERLLDVLAKSIQKLHDALEALGWKPESLPAPVSLWKLDEGEGTVANDSFGGNNGILRGDPEWIDGKIDGALSFNGVDDYVEVDNAAGIPIGSSARTLVAWLRPAAPSSVHRGAVGWSSSRGRRKIFMLFHNKNNKWMLVTYHHDGEFGEPIIEGQWYHVALTYEAGSATVMAYINGSFIDNIDLGAPLDTANNYTTIGKTSYQSTWFNGTIDEAAIYDKALSLEQIQQLYWNGLIEE